MWIKIQIIRIIIIIILLQEIHMKLDLSSSLATFQSTSGAYERLKYYAVVNSSIFSPKIMVLRLTRNATNINFPNKPQNSILQTYMS